MEHLVTGKIKEMEDRILAWDPDEYTEAYRQKLRTTREEKANQEQAGDL